MKTRKEILAELKRIKHTTTSTATQRYKLDLRIESLAWVLGLETEEEIKDLYRDL